MIAGFEAVSGGRIELDGRDITHAKPNTRGLGIVFQTYALFPHMTVEQNVAFGLEMRKCGPPSATAWRRPWRWCTWKSTAPATRATLRRPAPARGAGACAGDPPPVLLLDEPLSNLDAKLREEMHSSCATSSARSAPPPSWSRTTRARPCPSATAWW
jgi:putative spermidine/putrescine transport system ATP-binding protein